MIQIRWISAPWCRNRSQRNKLFITFTYPWYNTHCLYLYTFLFLKVFQSSDARKYLHFTFMETWNFKWVINYKISLMYESEVIYSHDYLLMLFSSINRSKMTSQYYIIRRWFPPLLPNSNPCQNENFLLQRHSPT